VMLRSNAVTEVNEELLESILHIVRTRVSGATDKDIKEGLGPGTPDKVRIDAYNALLRRRRLSLKTRDGQVIYEEVSAEAAAKLSGLSVEEHLVYSLIEKSGNLGIWTRDLRFRSGLQQNQFLKVLKTLETKRLVKAIKSVKAKNKKFYMLSDITPSKEVTGGPWYSDQKEYDNEFILVLSSHLAAFVRSQKKVSIREATQYVAKSGISKESLEVEHIASLFDIMTYDGLVEEIEAVSAGASIAKSNTNSARKQLKQDESETIASRMFKTKTPDTHLHSVLPEIPCTLCPLQSQCHPGGTINPASCEYLTEWLDF